MITFIVTETVNRLNCPLELLRFEKAIYTKDERIVDEQKVQRMWNSSG